MQKTIYKLNKYASKILNMVENNKSSKYDLYISHQNKYLKNLLNNDLMNRQIGGGDIDLDKLKVLFTTITEKITEKITIQHNEFEEKTNIEIKTLNKNINDITEEKNKLTQELINVKENMKKKNDEITELKKTHIPKVTAAVNKATEKYEKDLENKKNALEELRIRNDELILQINIKVKEIEQLKTEKDDLTKKNNLLNTQNENLKNYMKVSTTLIAIATTFVNNYYNSRTSLIELIKDQLIKLDTTAQMEILNNIDFINQKEKDYILGTTTNLIIEDVKVNDKLITKELINKMNTTLRDEINATNQLLEQQ